MSPASVIVVEFLAVVAKPLVRENVQTPNRRPFSEWGLSRLFMRSGADFPLPVL
jgi:hypothetical protein